jgi:hypothetical protein
VLVVPHRIAVRQRADFVFQHFLKTKIDFIDQMFYYALYVNVDHTREYIHFRLSQNTHFKMNMH